MPEIAALIACGTDGEKAILFDEKLKSLKPLWDPRELALSEKPTFHGTFRELTCESTRLSLYPKIWHASYFYLEIKSLMRSAQKSHEESF